MASLAFAIVGRAPVASVIAAVVFLLLAASHLSNASRLSGSLRELVGKPVLVTVWGAPIVPAGGAVMASVSAFGAGLLIRLQHEDSVRPILLKVAQPHSASITDGKLVIQDAAYVQWAGKRHPRQAGHDAVVLSRV